MGRFGCTALVGLVGLLGAQGGTAAFADEDDRPLEVSAIVGGHFFSSSSALGRSTYEAPNSSIQHSVAVGARFGYAISRYFLLEGEFLAMPTKLASQSNGQVLAYTGRGHLMFRWPFGPNRMIQPFVLLGGGALGVRPDPGLPLATETAGTFHAGIGLKVNVHKYVGVRLDGRMVLVPEVRTPTFTQDYEVLASVYARFGFTPEHPEPTKPVDVDNDGVADAEDKCPAEAGLKENLGCPDKDMDADGTVDRMDKCPDKAGPTENGGCPDVDTDSDGVVDRLDRCPNEVGPKGNKGCPDTDGDNDGVVDRFDKCPTEQETKNGYKDFDGCPDELPPNLAKFVGAIQGLKFLPNKAVLTKESFVILDEAVAALTEHRNIRVEISGHTDNVGVAADNMLLSQQRAEAVKTYLVSKGIDANRLIAEGFGSTKPVADNNTAAGRGQNRRVEFKLLPPLPRPKAAPAAQPTAPDAPGAPAAPTAPAAPAAPVDQAAPTAPAVPAVPAAPEAPAAPVIQPPPPPESWVPPAPPAPPAMPAPPPPPPAPSYDPAQPQPLPMDPAAPYPAPNPAPNPS